MVEESLAISCFILFNLLWVSPTDVLGPLMKIRKIVEINTVKAINYYLMIQHRNLAIYETQMCIGWKIVNSERGFFFSLDMDITCLIL